MEFWNKCKEGIANILILTAEIGMQAIAVAYDCVCVCGFICMGNGNGLVDFLLVALAERMEVKVILETTKPCLSNFCYIYIIGLCVPVKTEEWCYWWSLRFIEYIQRVCVCVAVCGWLREPDWSGCELMVCIMMVLVQRVCGIFFGTRADDDRECSHVF